MWRNAAEATDPLTDQPAPVLVDPTYAFRPCVFTPCRASEYPMMCTECDQPEGEHVGWEFVRAAAR